MATAMDMLMRFGRECGDHPADPILAMDWLQARYASVLERAAWPFLIKETTFQTVGEITAGTVTVTNGSATVTETTSNANGWSSAVEGRYFRRDGDSEFYLISTFSNLNPDTLTLARNYEGSSGTVIGYSITQRIYSLASDCREVLWMTVIDAPTRMEKSSVAEFDRAFLNRPQVGSPPVFWAPLGRDSSNVMQVEVYPIPDEVHGILYHYIQSTPTVTASTTIMPQVNHSLLRAGWLSDYWSWRAAHDDAPAGALLAAGKYEEEFARKMQEMMVRESPNFPAVVMRLDSRYAGNHGSKFGLNKRSVTLP
jgi:hypothetical protein